jgi:uncharacterized membrane protein YkvI
MNKESIGTFRVAATYIGTVVGAGFASGQEVLQFFSFFGAWGAIGLALVTVLFIYFGVVIMDLGRGVSARSHLEVIRHSGGKVLGGIIDAIISFFLFGSLTTMIAGTGALFVQEFHLPGLLGCGLMAILTAITVLTGIRGVINSISIVVPFLIAAVVGTCVFAMMQTPPDFHATMYPAATSGIITNWFMASILYVSYNTLVSVAVLGPLGVHARNKKTISRGALLGGLGLGVAAFLIYLALSGNLSMLSRVEVPMLYLAGSVSSVLQIAYAVVLAAEIYTTAVGSLYGFAARFTDTKKSPAQGSWIIIIVTVAAFWASQLGFSNLVRYLYPIAGYGGLLLLAILVYCRIKYRRTTKA